MNKLVKKLMAFIMVVSTFGLFARGGHGGGGHHGGGHRGGRGGGHRGHRAGHHGGHHGGHKAHHGGHGRHAGYRGGRGWGGRGWGRGGFWGAGWGWGVPWWVWGATAAVVASLWYYGGYTIDQWEEMAQQDPDKKVYYETKVLPAYQQYQRNPNSVPVREIKEISD